MTSPKTFMAFAGMLGLILAIPAFAQTQNPKAADLMPSKVAMPSGAGTGGGMMGAPKSDPTALPPSLSSPTTPTTGSSPDPMGSPTSPTTPTTGSSPDPMGSPTSPASTSPDPTGGASSPAPAPTDTSSPTMSPSPSSSPKGTAKPKKSSSTVVDVNTASLTELQTVKGIGAATAKKIVAARPYKSLDELVVKKALTAAQLKTLKANLKY